MSTFIDKLPLLIFSSAENKTKAQRIARLTKAGRLRKIHSGIYTSDLSSPLEQIVRSAWRQIAEYLYPLEVIAYRSAQLGMPKEMLMNRD